LLYQYKIFKNDLNLTIFAQFFWIRPVVKLWVKKVKRTIIWNWGSSTFWDKSTCNNHVSQLIIRNIVIAKIKKVCCTYVQKEKNYMLHVREGADNTSRFATAIFSDVLSWSSVDWARDFCFSSSFLRNSRVSASIL